MNKDIKIIPRHIIVCLILSAIGLGYEVAILLLKISIGYGNIYYTIFVILAALGLLITSLVSLKDWSKFIKRYIEQ